MNIYEASKKFKKIRRNKWSESSCINLGDETDIFQMFTLPKESIIADDWEEYKEPVKYLTHKETMQALIDGKKISKEYWNKSDYVVLDENGFMVDGRGYSADPCFGTENSDNDSKFYVTK